MSDVTDMATLQRILRECRVVAMVGLSAKWNRPSYFAASYLQRHNYRIIPVNPRYEEVLGEKCYPDVDSIPHPVDVVDVFRRAELVTPIAHRAAAIGARVLWLQLGIVNEEAAAVARAAGMTVVMNRCMKIEHARFSGGLNWFGMSTGVISARRR